MTSVKCPPHDIEVAFRDIYEEDEPETYRRGLRCKQCGKARDLWFAEYDYAGVIDPLVGKTDAELISMIGPNFLETGERP